MDFPLFIGYNQTNKEIMYLRNHTSEFKDIYTMKG